MKLETSVELLERVRAKHDNVSWYRLARMLPASESSVANWKNGRTTIDRKFVTRVAELLEESPEYVLLCLETEREQSAELRKVWRRIAERFRSTTSILLAGVMLVGAGKPMSAGAHAPAAEGSCVETVYYGKSRRKLAGWLKNKNGRPLALAWTWARIRSMGSVLRTWSPSPVPI